jgi:nucleoside-diphosphate-sugar epimerase
MGLAFTKVLVTGGAGFIGSHLVDSLVREGCRVTVLDNLSSGHMDNLEDVKNLIEFVQGDIQDRDTLVRLAGGCDAIFHQAAVVSVTKTVEDPVSSTQVNDLGTLQVLDAARIGGVKRVILASSSAVYGDDPQLPKTENMPTKPLSPYAVQKLTNEFYARLYYSLYDLPTTCLRYFNVFGPRQDPSSPYSGVISIFLKKAVDGERPTIYGDGRQTRDFVFVKDVVRANILAAQNKAAAGQIYNVGTGHSIEIIKLWEKISALAESKHAPQYAAERSGDIMHSLSDIGKARTQLGYKPEIPIPEGLRLTFEWYQNKK